MRVVMINIDFGRVDPVPVINTALRLLGFTAAQVKNAADLRFKAVQRDSSPFKIIQGKKVFWTGRKRRRNSPTRSLAPPPPGVAQVSKPAVSPISQSAGRLSKLGVRIMPGPIPMPEDKRNTKCPRPRFALRPLDFGFRTSVLRPNQT